jgi:hypothetical protein
VELGRQEVSYKLIAEEAARLNEAAPISERIKQLRVHGINAKLNPYGEYGGTLLELLVEFDSQGERMLAGTDAVSSSRDNEVQ